MAVSQAEASGAKKGRTMFWRNSRNGVAVTAIKQDPRRGVGQPAGKKREDQSGQNTGGDAEAQDGKVRGIRQELAAFQGFKELRVNLDAGDAAALSVGRCDTVVSGRDGSHADKDGLSTETFG